MQWHNVGGAYPYEPGITAHNIWVPQDEEAREQLWPHLRSLLTKLGLLDRVQAVVFAYENGIVRPGTGEQPGRE